MQSARKAKNFTAKAALWLALSTGVFFGKALAQPSPSNNGSGCHFSVKNDDNYNVTYSKDSISIDLPDGMRYVDYRIRQFPEKSACPIIGIHTRQLQNEMLLYVGVFDSLKPRVAFLYGFPGGTNKVRKYDPLAVSEDQIPMSQLDLSDPSVLRVK